MGELISAGAANGIGVVGVVLIVGGLIWRGYLVPRPAHLELVNLHKDSCAKAEQQRDRWEAVALKALNASEQLAEPMTVTAKVLTKLPTPTPSDGADA